MLTVHHISKSYNLNSILKDVSFSLNLGERVGLIGSNGCGKTTLLRIISGEEKPDEGHIHLSPKNLRLGYLPQGFVPDTNLTFGSLIKEKTADPRILEEKLKILTTQLATEPDNEDLLCKYDDLLERLQQPSTIGQLSSILNAFQLNTVNEERLVSTLSGGQKTRLSLALVLHSNPQLLLLDEPTNHLDIVMLEWLEDWLSTFRGTALIVTHDRTFLEQTVTRILVLNPEDQSIHSYQGTYTDYLVQVNREHEKQWAEYRDQVAEIRRIKQDIARTKEQARQVEITTTSREPGVRRSAKKVAVKAKSREKKLNRFLKSDERIERPKSGWQIKVNFDSQHRLGKDILFLQNLSIGYPGNIPLVSDINLQVQSGQRIILTGPNGAGKTTLIRTILGHLDPLEGEVQIGSSVNLGYMSQEQEILETERTPVEIIQSITAYNHTNARNFLHHYLFSGDDALRPVKLLSYGERSRLMLARLVAKGCNFLLLDEPINHLDIPSREQFEQALKTFDGTVLAVVHDRFFIKRFVTDLWYLEDNLIYREVIQSNN